MQRAWTFAACAALAVTATILPSIPHLDTGEDAIVEATGATAPAIVPLTPARVLDTREPIGVPAAAPVGPDGVIDVQFAGRGGVPGSGVGGVVLNLTIVAPTQPTFVTAWPTGEPRPLAASLTASAGQVIANMVVVKLGPDGTASLFNRFGATDLVADVTGWVPIDGDLTTITPARLMDTRDGTGGHLGAVGAGRHVELDVTGEGGVPASGVGTVVLNVTVTDPTAASFMTAWPAGEERPLAASLNWTPGQTIPNLVIAKVGANGKVSFYNRFGTAHFVVDVFAHAPVGSTLIGVTPSRLLDTRDGTGTGAPGAVPADTAIELSVTGTGGVAATGVTGVVLNVTTTQATAASFVTTWPKGLTRPLASSLNMLAGETIPNLVVVPVGAGGEIRLYNRFGEAHLIADVVAYLTPPAGVTAPVIAPETVAVEPHQIVAIGGDPDADDSITITFASGTDVVVGSIVVSPPGPDAPSGLLRRITSVGPAPGGGAFAVAERATLTDAVPEGSFDIVAPAEPVAALAESSGVIGVQNYDRALECGTSVKLQTSVDGSIDPSINFSLDWDLSGLHTANVTVGLDVILNLQGSATAALTCSANAGLFAVQFSPIAVPIGGFPFFFVPEITLDLTATGSLQGSISGTAAYGVQITAGIVYDEATGVDTVGAVTPTATSDWNAQALATAGVTLTPKLLLGAYGLGGPEAGVPFGVSVDLDPCRTPLWKLTSSIKAQIGIALNSWLGGLTIANTEFTLNENVIAEGGDPIPDFPGCDSSVEITGHRVEAHTEARGGIRTGDTYHRHDEMSLNRSVDWNEQGLPLGRFERSWQTTDIYEDTPDLVYVGPFSVFDHDRSASSTAINQEGLSGRADASVSLMFTENDETMLISGEVTATASTPANGPNTESGAVLSFEFVLEGGRTIFLDGCPPDGMSAHLGRVNPGPTDNSAVPTISEICAAPVPLAPGIYGFGTRAGASAYWSGEGWPDQTWEFDLYLTG